MLSASTPLYQTRSSTAAHVELEDSYQVALNTLQISHNDSRRYRLSFRTYWSNKHGISHATKLMEAFEGILSFEEYNLALTRRARSFLERPNMEDSRNELVGGKPSVLRPLNHQLEEIRP